MFLLLSPGLLSRHPTFSDWPRYYPLTDGVVFPSQIPPVFGHIDPSRATQVRDSTLTDSPVR